VNNSSYVSPRETDRCLLSPSIDLGTRYEDLLIINADIIPGESMMEILRGAAETALSR